MPWLLIAALSGFTAVALGAFGAHALKAKLAADMLAVYQTGVEYHFYHSLALLAVGVLCLQFPQNNWFNTAGWMFAVGLLFFSGSLYVLALSGVKVLGAITPIGGVLFLLGWACLAWGASQVGVK